VLGSAGYIAPERVLGDKASPSADLWSLGATLYTAVEGRGLHGRRSAAAALAALTSGAPIPMERAGPLAPVLRGLLQIDPAARLDAVRAAVLLARIAAGGSGEDPSPQPHRPIRPPASTAVPTAPRKPQHRGQHRAEPRPVPRVAPRSYPRDPQDSGPHQTRNYPQNPRRPAEGVHRKPTGPARHHGVGVPVIQRLVQVIAMVLPRRYRPKKLK
jgi:serine/threonine protein kinase